MPSEKTNFGWPAAVWQRVRTRPVRDFVQELAATENQPFTYARLQARYYEWCECFDLRPVRGWGRWQRAIKAAGVERIRSSEPGRPWLYQVRKKGASYKSPPPQFTDRAKKRRNV